MGDSRKQFPRWAVRQRTSDLAWIAENLHVFWPVALESYETQGRGALVVDTTLRPTGEGNPFLYMPLEGAVELDDADLVRMVRGYDPERELVIHVLKHLDRVSTYRVGAPWVGR